MWKTLMRLMLNTLNVSNGHSTTLVTFLVNSQHVYNGPSYLPFMLASIILAQLHSALQLQRSERLLIGQGRNH